MTLTIICLVAFLASGLTFFSGFGLGTLLLPAFALFFPIEHAVALTGVVHFLNGLFKLGLVGRKADMGVLIRFGVPAFAASFAGALVLTQLADVPPIASYPILGKLAVVTPVKVAIGGLLLVFAGLEVSERFGRVALPPRYLPVGGVLSGFFGGLAGMQGALRSAFLVRAGLTKEAFIGTGVAIAALIDLSRIGVYSAELRSQAHELDYGLLAGAVLSAFAGAFLGNRYLTKLTMQHVQRIVAVLLGVVGLGLIFGVL
ncbi:TSUP family transporter [Pseudoxanthomonas wuyuanensis]